MASLRAAARLGACAALLLTMLLMLPASAGAHAVLKSSSPANEETVEQVPEVLTLRFSENVGVAFGGTKVFGPDGSRIDAGKAEVSGKTVRVPIQPAGEGTYAASWRIISADTHPVRGAFVFHVGASSGDAVSRERAEQAAQVSRISQVAFGVARFAVLLGALAGTGALAFAVLIAPGAQARWAGSLLLIAATGSVAAFVLDAMIAGGFTVGEALRWDVVREQAGNTYGTASLARAVLAGVAAALWFAARRVSGVRSARWLRTGALAVAVALVLALSVSGHAIALEPVWLHVAADMLHVLAATVWLGGLVQLALLLRERARPFGEEARIVARFSTLAFTSVIVLVATGSFAAVSEIGFDREALLDTTYGRLVIGKVLLFLAVIPLAGLNRNRNVPALVSGQGAADARSRLSTYVRVEAAIIVIVLALTAWLIATQPARDAVQPELVDRQLELRRGTAQVTIDPAGTGPNVFHLYVFGQNGMPDGEVTAADIELENPERGIGPLDIELENAGPGHYTVAGATIPQPGIWQVTLSIRRGELSEERERFNIEVRSAS